MPRTTCRWSPRSRSRRRPAAERPAAGRVQRSEAVPQLLDLVGQLGLTRPRRLDHGGRGARHERLVGESLASGRQPALGLGQVADESVAFQGVGVGVGRLRPDGRLDLAAGDDHRQVARSGGRLERLGGQLAMQRPGAGEPLDGRAERLERRTELERHVDQRLQPVGGRELAPTRGRCGSRRRGR